MNKIIDDLLFSARQHVERGDFKIVNGYIVLLIAAIALHLLLSIGLPDIIKMGGDDDAK